MKILRNVTDALMHIMMWGSVLATIVMWKKLPAKIPVKFNFSGDIVAMGDKKFLWVLLAVMLLVYAVHFVLMKLIQKVKGVSLTDELEKAAQDICLSLWCVDFGAVVIVGYVAWCAAAVKVPALLVIILVFVAMTIGFFANIIRWALRKK